MDTASIAPPVELHRLSHTHAEALFALINNNRSYLRQWLGWLDHSVKLQDTEAFIDACNGSFLDRKSLVQVIVVDGRICGLVDLHCFDHINRRAAIGYWLAENETGRGIMTEAVRQIMQTGFGDYNLHRIEIYCAVENTASRAIPERLGFNFEGILKQREWLYTRFVDHAVYAYLRA